MYGMDDEELIEDEPESNACGAGDGQLDIEKVIKGIQAHKEGYKTIQDKDIVFFLGNTGSGKTTTINYISGRKMIEQEQETVVEVEDGESFTSTKTVIDCENIIPGFTIGHCPKSETTSVHTYACPTSSLLLCDSPGIMDTNGMEVDVSNAVGICNTLLHARSVRLVLVLDFNTISVNRGQVFKDFLEQISHFVQDIGSHLNSLTVLFTRADSARFTKVRDALGALIMEPHVRSDKPLFSFLTHLIKYVGVHKDKLIVDPLLEGKHLGVVEVIRCAEPLKSESGLFGLMLLPQVRLVLIEHITSMVPLVQGAIHEGNFARLKVTLDKLKLLSEEIHMLREIKQVYALSTKLTNTYITDMVVKTRNLMQSDLRGMREGMDRLHSALQLQEHLENNINEEYEGLVELINHTVATLVDDIGNESSYMVIGRKLSALKDIESHLLPLLSEDYKTIHEHMLNCVLMRVAEQGREIDSKIERLNKGEVQLIDSLVALLETFSKVGSVDSTITFYEEKVEKLVNILESNHVQFSKALKSTTTPELAQLKLCFQVLKDIEGNRALLAHIPDNKCKFKEVSAMLNTRLEQLKRELEHKILESDYEAVADLFSQLTLLLSVDAEVGVAFRASHLTHTIELIEKHITNSMNELKKQVSKEIIEKTASLDDYSEICATIKRLQSARKIEKELPQQDMISSFLDTLKVTITERVQAIMTRLTNSMNANDFDLTLQFVEEFSRLVGLQDITPVISLFQSFSEKIEREVTALLERVGEHCDSSSFTFIVEDRRALDGYYRITSVVYKGGLSKIEGVSATFTNITDRILDCKSAMIEAIQRSWQDLSKQYAEDYELLFSPTTRQDVGKASQAKKLGLVLQKLQALAESNIDTLFKTSKPSAEYSTIINKLKTKVDEFVEETTKLIDRSSFESAEQNLVLLKAISTAVEGILVPGTHSNLSAVLLERRHNLRQQIPDKLKNQQFSEIAEILTKLKSSVGDPERGEYKQTCTIVKAHFQALGDAPRKTAESMFAVLAQCRKASALDQLDDDFGIAALLNATTLKLQSFLKKKREIFTGNLANYKFKGAHDIMREMEGYLQEAPELEEIQFVHALQGEFNSRVSKLTEVVKDIVESSHDDYTKIDVIVNELEELRMLEEYKGGDTDVVKAYVLAVATQKDAKLKEHIKERQVVEAEQELVVLKSLAELKCLSGWKRNSGHLEQKREDVETMKRDWFDMELVVNDPEKLSEHLEAVRHRPAVYSTYVAQVEIKLRTMSEEIIRELGTIMAADIFALTQLATKMGVFEKSSNAFQNHKKLTRFTSVFSQVVALLHTKCSVNELEQVMRSKNWSEAERKLKVMKRIVEIFPRYVQKDFKDTILKKHETMHSVINSVQTNMEYLKNLNFYSPIRMDELNIRLMQVKQDSFAQFYTKDDHIVSYEDIIKSIMKTVEHLRPTTDALWDEGKYAQVSHLHENLKQHDKLVGHELLASLFAQELIHYRDAFAAEIAFLTTQATTLFTNREMDRLEVVLVKFSAIYSSFSKFKELFPSQKNEVLEVLRSSVSHQVSDFSLKHFATVPDVDIVVSILHQMKKLTSTLSNTELATHVCREMQTMLYFLEHKIDFHQLSTQLCETGPLRRDVVDTNNFPQFRSMLITTINDVIRRMANPRIFEVLAKINNMLPAHKKLLEEAYTKFETQFAEALASATKHSEDYANKIRAAIKKQKPGKSHIPGLLASVFAVWSVTNSQSFLEAQHNKMAFSPHPVQVISIFRIFELDVPTGLISSLIQGDQVAGHLLQAASGDGKSIILGILATLLALLGYSVSCVSYSQYLSVRDYNKFKNLFIQFGVAKNIQYSTLSQLTQNLMNEQDSLQASTKAFIDGTKIGTAKRSKKTKILLIDDVDILFSKELYGATYSPFTFWQHNHITYLLEYIWQFRDNISLSVIKYTAPYKELIRTHESPDVRKIIDREITRMIEDCKIFNNPPYIITKNSAGQATIGYEENGVVSSTQHRYKLCFAYMNEGIPKEVVAQHLGMTVNCGLFSCAEIPKSFSCIIGVTGGLKSTLLNSFVNRAKNEDYNFEKLTRTPSHYGISHLVFSEKTDVIVEPDESFFFQRIVGNIIEKIGHKQPVLVFFETEKKMNNFAENKHIAGIEVNMIKEDTKDISFQVKKATVAGKVTLLPRVFARGVDFVCTDEQVEKAGGLHVIQTFLSEDLSEEMQIRGRTARQGKKGSYTLIISLPDLVKQYAVTADAVLEQKKGSNLYEFLNSTRDAMFEQKFVGRKGIVERSAQNHEESITFCKNLKSVVEGALFKDKEASTLKYLVANNQAVKAKSRTVCVCEATGSMAAVWANAKAHIAEVIERIAAVAGSGKSELMWVAYRDYADTKLLEHSEWTTFASELVKFIGKISCSGGDDNFQAVEAGLKFVCDTAANATRVILIGDTPPHLELKGKLVPYLGKRLETDYIEQAEMLAKKNIPVFCFYMTDEPELKKSFTKIATITGGTASRFSNTNTLVDVIAESVLDDIGGEEMVLAYRNTYIL